MAPVSIAKRPVGADCNCGRRIIQIRKSAYLGSCDKKVSGTFCEELALRVLRTKGTRHLLIAHYLGDFLTNAVIDFRLGCRKRRQSRRRQQTVNRDLPGCNFFRPTLVLWDLPILGNGFQLLTRPLRKQIAHFVFGRRPQKVLRRFRRIQNQLLHKISFVLLHIPKLLQPYRLRIQFGRERDLVIFVDSWLPWLPQLLARLSRHLRRHRDDVDTRELGKLMRVSHTGGNLPRLRLWQSKGKHSDFALAGDRRLLPHQATIPKPVVDNVCVQPPEEDIDKRGIGDRRGNVILPSTKPKRAVDRQTFTTQPFGGDQSCWCERYFDNKELGTDRVTATRVGERCLDILRHIGMQFYADWAPELLRQSQGMTNRQHKPDLTNAKLGSQCFQQRICRGNPLFVNLLLDFGIQQSIVGRYPRELTVPQRADRFDVTGVEPQLGFDITQFPPKLAFIRLDTIGIE